MANQIAQSMSDNDKESLENMDMEKMISHVTQNVFKMMNGSGQEGMPDIMGLMSGMNFSQTPEPEIEDIDDTDSECLFPKTRDICFDLNVDLEDFYTGKKKKLNVKRKRIIVENGKQKVVEEKKKLVIPIERGMKDEQQIRFEGEADQIPGYSPGDIIITLIENEHPVFERDGNNLIIVKNINLYRFNYIDGVNQAGKYDRTQLGFIAQQVKQHFPKSVRKEKLRIEDKREIPDLAGVDVSQINFTLFGAVKQLMRIVEKQNKRIKKLEEMLGIVDDDEVENDADEPYTRINCEDEVDIDTIEPSEPEGV